MVVVVLRLLTFVLDRADVVEVAVLDLATVDLKSLACDFDLLLDVFVALARDRHEWLFLNLDLVDARHRNRRPDGPASSGHPPPPGPLGRLCSRRLSDWVRNVERRRLLG